jgi:hypothetical protein
MQLRTRDDVADMFVKRMMKIHGQARERLLQIQARQRETAEYLISTLASMLEVIGAEGSADEKIRHIEQVVTEKGGLDGLRGRMRGSAILEPQQLFSVVGSPLSAPSARAVSLGANSTLVSTSPGRAC